MADESKTVQALLETQTELRQFNSRLMTGYESSHRRTMELCEMLAARLEGAEKATARVLELQVRVAEEREELISQRHRRDLESELAKQKSASFAALAGDVRSLTPLVLKRLLGIPLTGNDSHGLQDLLATLEPAQIGEVIETGVLKLTVGQRQLLTSTLSSLGESEAKRSAPAVVPEAAE